MKGLPRDVKNALGDDEADRYEQVGSRDKWKPQETQCEQEMKTVVVAVVLVFFAGLRRVLSSLDRGEGASGEVRDRGLKCNKRQTGRRSASYKARAEQSEAKLTADVNTRPPIERLGEAANLYAPRCRCPRCTATH